MEKEYNDSAYCIAEAGLSSGRDDIERYLETGQTDEAYEVMGNYLSELSRYEWELPLHNRLEGIELTYVYDVTILMMTQPFQLR